MTLRLDDALMFRDALDGLHGLDPALRTTLVGSFAEVQSEVARRRSDGEYGFLALGRQPEVVRAIGTWASAQKGRYDHLLVLGIGGSSLGAKALLGALKPAQWNALSSAAREGHPAITVLENIDPVTVEGALAHCSPGRTLVNVISKSGGTSETLAQYLIVRSWLDNAVGVEAARSHLVLTTDPEVGPLRGIANAEAITAFAVPPAVGGRYSVLSAVGLVPAAILGIDIGELVAGAQEAVLEGESPALDTNPAARWAALQWQAQVSRAASIHVLMPYSDRLRDFAEWFRQLWAESLGKRVDRQGREVFRGPTPIAAIGATDQHSQIQLFMEGPFDKSITFLRVMDTRDRLPIPGRPNLPPEMSFLAGKSLGALLDAELQATREALRSKGRMSSTIELATIDARTFGRLLMFFQIATGYAGVWYDVNPFDQPGVEFGKQLTLQAMGRKTK